MDRLLLLCFCYLPSSIFAMDVHFKDTVCIEPYIEYLYKTCRDLSVDIDGTEIVIPSEFKTDLASVPRVLWPIMSPAESDTMPPAILHDFLYHNTCYYTRQETDLIFYTALRENKVSKFKASAMYYAVRLFGWRFYQAEQCE